MTNTTAAALIAFFALGANLVAILLLLMMNPRSRSVRGYVIFMAVVCVWLFTQGVLLLNRDSALVHIYLLAVTALPGFFLMFVLLDDADRPVWHALAVVAVTTLLAPIAAPALACEQCSPPRTALMWSMMIIGWIGGSVLMWRCERRAIRREVNRAAAPIRKRIVLLALLLVAPISVTAAIIADSGNFPLFVIPLITVAIQILVFYGVTRLQFYQIDVRVHRSGEVAAATLETERLAVVGELAATVAHEVRNPLTGVRSLAQRIAQDDVAPDKRKRYGEVILEETGRVERLVENLLELSRRSVQKPEGRPQTPLTTLFDDLQLLAATRAERAGVELRMSAHQLMVPAPREALLQVLLNLLLNAIAHSPRGGTVDVAAGRSGERFEIRVRDEGAGVPVADRERIFDPFFSTSAHGTGLGLSVVRHLAREHGWQVDVTDAPGRGALFRLIV